MSYPVYLNSTPSLIAAVNLSLGMEWYTIDERSLFPVYGLSGGLAFSICAVLIGALSPTMDGKDFGMGFHDDDELGTWYALIFDGSDSLEDVQAKIYHAVSTVERAMEQRFAHKGIQ